MKPKIINTESYTRTFSPFSLIEIDDVMFGRTGRNISVSYDRGRTREQWYQQTDSELGNIQTLIAVNQNKVIAGIQSNNSDKEGYYLFEKVNETITTRFLHPKEDEWMGIAFSQDRYPRNGPGNKIILMAEYGKQGTTTFARNLYVYQEENETFRNIFKLPNFVENKTHMHGAHYDWRTDTVWVCSGDGAPSANLFYSNDWRTENPTFHGVWTQGTAPVQFTSIYSTNDLILLGSDGVGDDGLYSINKTSNKTYNNPTLTKRYHLRNIGETGGFPMVARTFLEYDGKIYVVFSSKRDFPSKILASDNGYDWHELYSVDNYELAVTHLFGDKLVLLENIGGPNFKELTIAWESEPVDPIIVRDSKRVLEGYFVVNKNGVIKGIPMTNLSGLTQGTIVWGSPE